MLGIFLAFLAVTSFASAYPGYPWAGGFAGGYAGPAAYTGVGFWPFGGFPSFGFPWPSVYIPYAVPWYKGPNVCEETKVVSNPDEAIIKDYFKDLDDGSISSDFQHESDYCKGNNEKYVCVKTSTTSEGAKTEVTTYRCCHGYVRATDGRPGCVEIDLRYLMPTLRNMGASELVKVVEKVGMADSFHNNNYTLFCPPNSALEAFQRYLEDDMDNEVHVKHDHQRLKKKSQLYNLLASHLSTGFLKIDDLGDNDLLPSENHKTKIRINVYFTPEKVVTANCVPILSGNHLARNGIIHVIEKVLPTPSKTVADIIASDTQFSIVKRMLSMAGLVQTLRNPNGSFTLFAPSDSAFTSDLSLQSGGGSDNRCAISVMKHHIIQHVICSSALLHHARSMNMIGELITLTRDPHNKLYVDGVQIVVRDLLATNGVVHIIDGLLSTRQTKSVSQVLEESGLNEFLFLLEAANLRSEFDAMENATFFIPTDKALKGFRSKYLQSFLSRNKTFLDVLHFHIAEGQTELTSADRVMQSKLGNSTLRVQVHTTYPQMTPQMLVQCAAVLSADVKLCGGTLHVVDKLLMPPKQTILQFLESVEEFSTLVLLLRVTGLDSRLGGDGNPYTLLAPTDDAFHHLGELSLFRILEDIDKATDLVKMHILLGSVCCTHMKNDLLSGRRGTRMMDGSMMTLDRSFDGVVMVGGARVVNCDIVATNGVVHMVNAVLSHDPTSLLGGGYVDNVFMLV